LRECITKTKIEKKLSDLFGKVWKNPQKNKDEEFRTSKHGWNLMGIKDRMTDV
jgi:hypothetical protein